MGPTQEQEQAWYTSNFSKSVLINDFIGASEVI